MVSNGDRILEKTECLGSCGRARTRQKAIIISELRQSYPLKDLLKLSGMARSTYYYYLHGKIKTEILDIFNANKCKYGYRKSTEILKEKGYKSTIKLC